jgi:hypothetical protein
VNKYIASVAALGLGLAASAASAIPGIYSTGVDNNGVALAAGALDTHYVFAAISGTAVGSGPSNNRGVVEEDVSVEQYQWTRNLESNWNTPGVSSRWLVPATHPIGVYPTYDQVNPGVYTWTTTFKLNTKALTHNVRLVGKAGADNSLEVFLNGSLIAQSPLDSAGNNTYSFQDGLATNFTVYASGLIAGINTLTFKVTNSVGLGNPTGLRTYLALVPEPGTWGLMASGLLLLLTARRRAAQRG